MCVHFPLRVCGIQQSQNLICGLVTCCSSPPPPTNPQPQRRLEETDGILELLFTLLDSRFAGFSPLMWQRFYTSALSRTVVYNFQPTNGPISHSNTSFSMFVRNRINFHKCHFASLIKMVPPSLKYAISTVWLMGGLLVQGRNVCG